MELVKFKVGEPAIFFFNTTIIDISTLELGSDIIITGLFNRDSFEHDEGDTISLENDSFDIRKDGEHALFVFIKQNVLEKRGYGYIKVTITSGSDTEVFYNGFSIGSDWDVPVSLTYSYNERDNILTVTRTPLKSDGNPIDSIKAKVDTFIYDEDNNGRIKKVDEYLES